MHLLTKRLTLPAAIVAALAFAAPASAVNLLVNGDFATNDLTGWTTTGAAGVVDASSGAAVFVGGGSPDGNLVQDFAAQTIAVTLSFEFVNGDPTGGDRATNFFLRGGVGGQINMRVRPGGDLQIFQSGGPSWQDIFPDGTAVNDGVTVNTLSLTVNDFGANFDYDVTVNGNTVTGLGFFQNLAPPEISGITFTNDFGATAFTIDNVSVDPIPEPSGALLLAMGALGLAVRRRKR